MRVMVAVFTLASCAPPPQAQPEPQQPYAYPPQQQPYPQQPYAYAPPPQASASCQDTLQCYGQCNPLTQQCMGVCDQRATPDAQQNAHATLQCMAQSGCADQQCVAQRCGAQLSACTNGAYAAAQPAAAPAPSGGDETMQPEYYVGGTLKVPPPRRLLGPVDLAGEWHQDGGAISQYATSSGHYAGFRSASIAEVWTVSDRGRFEERVKGATINGGVSGFEQHTVGTLTIDKRNVVTIYRGAHDGLPESWQRFIVDGWFVGPDVVMMKLQGPFANEVTADDLANVQGMSYRDRVYVKAR